MGGTIISANKNYLATLRDDGNFVIYVSSHFVDSNIVWQTRITTALRTKNRDDTKNKSSNFKELLAII